MVEQYSLKSFQLPSSFYDQRGVLDNTEFESHAIRIIQTSQKQGKWTSTRERSITAWAMEEAGLLHETAEGFMLTNLALEEMVGTYGLRPKSIPGIHMLFHRHNPETGEKEYLFHQRLHTGFMDNHYSVPGGHIDSFETPEHAVIREGQEEAGVIIAPRDIRFAALIYRTKKDVREIRTDLCFFIDKWQGIPEPKETKHGPFFWRQPTNLPQPMVPYVEQAINAIEKGLSYITANT